MKKKIATESFIATTYMMMDAMAPVTILSQFFQKENVDMALVKVKTDDCIVNLQKVNSFDTPYMQEFKEDRMGNTFKEQHQITKNNFKVDIYGDEEIDRLCTYYGETKTVQWEISRSIERKTSEPVVDSVMAKIEETFLKKVVSAEKEDFPNLLKLVALALTSAVHTTGCEHGFSAQNRILVKARNRLNIETQHKLRTVKLCTVPFGVTGLEI
ncbi:hypothetical protein ACJMK2_021071 [Sinanodonta woodiana]|uniref:HAT C-terminal dimerisation domain-containing protein n=1 Tax=Sinanodonta woodiana TaxID=1069815 RepID=A0ABD3U110_SINWO